MTISNYISIQQNLAQGYGIVMPQLMSAASTTAAAAGSGYFTSALRINALGTTQPTTIVGLLSKDNATNQMLSVFNSAANTSVGRITYMGRYYRIGGVTLGSTGNNFTHDSATFPVSRNVMGQTSALNLIPVIYVTTALTGTAAVFTLSTSGSSSGYVNQSGSSVTGNVSFTFPSATTLAASAYIPMLNYGDSGVQDITSVNVSMAATTGAFDIYGFEPYMLGSGLVGISSLSVHNAALGMTFTDTKPASAASGTATTFEGYLSLALDSTAAQAGIDIKVSNQ